jgi:hypothetical protein
MLAGMLYTAGILEVDKFSNKFESSENNVTSLFRHTQRGSEYVGIRQLKSVVLATPGMALLLYMRNKIAKALRRQAEALTVGQSKKVTRRTYRGLKKEYKKK